MTYLLASAMTALAAFGLTLIDLDVTPAVEWSIPIWGVALITIAS